MIGSTKEIYSYKTPESFWAIPSSVNKNNMSFSKLNMGITVGSVMSGLKF